MPLRLDWRGIRGSCKGKIGKSGYAEAIKMNTEKSVNSPPPWNKTRVAATLGIEYPIIQGPLGGLSTQRLTATVSNFGGLGSFGAHGLSPSVIRDVIAEIRELTAKPFAINLWVSMEDEGAPSSGIKEFQRSLAHVAKHIEALGGKIPEYSPYISNRFEDQARVLLDAKVPVFSFIVGIPPKEILDECRTQGIVTIGTATTPAEAIALEQGGVNVIVASGFEAGGHRGSFILPAEESLTGTFSLTPQVKDAVSVPLVAAGGIADARGVLAAFALGAEGVQIGTAFVASEESGASPIHRNALLSENARNTALTKGFTGRVARGIRNQLVDELNRPGVEILPYPLQRFLVRNLSIHAEKAGKAELLPLWAGQSAGLSREPDAKAFLQKLVSEIADLAGPILDWNRERSFQN
jgi:nitronate monooxygenase